MVQTVTANNFDEITNTDKPVLLDFWATWCGPCQMQGPVIDSLAESMTTAVFGKINVDEEMELAQRFGVMSIPTLVVLKNGEVVNQAVGFHDASAIEAMLK